jgi:hypothetical protein
MQLSELYLMEAWNWKQFGRAAVGGAALGAVGLGAVALSRGDSNKPKPEPSPKVRKHEPESRPRKIQATQPKMEPKPEPKVEPKPEPKVEPEPKPEPKPNQLTTNFNLSEFASKDGSETPPQVLDNIKRLAKNLQVLRDAAGAPISLTSGYRSPKHNAKVGGVSNSQHVQGTAADIQIPGMSPRKVHALIEQLIADGKMDQGGLGLYVRQGFVHYDVRGTRARWSK